MRAVGIPLLLSGLVLTGCAFDQRTGKVRFDLTPDATPKHVQKLTPAEIQGVYNNQSLTENHTASFERMTVKRQASGGYQVVIESTSGKGCQFDVVGELQGQQIGIPLSRYQTHLSSVMVISFMPQKASISTADPKNLSDLNTLCSTGATLLSDFHKVE